jgi:hypothetical protein
MASSPVALLVGKTLQVIQLSKGTTMKIKYLAWILGCVALSACHLPISAHAALTTGYEMHNYPVSASGQFTAYNGQIHYWTASSGYQIYNVASGATTTIGLPPNGINTNGYGDAFGVLDTSNSRFYAATVYGSSDGDVYIYDGNAATWQTPGKNGVMMANAYGGQVQNGQLYVSGLAEPWNGGYGQDTYIFAFDHSAAPGSTARHDTLIQTAGNGANLAVAPNGDVYYGTYSTNTLYRWTAEQVAGVKDDLYASGAVDHFLTLTDAAQNWSLPGGGNGLAVDAGGNVFFAVNHFNSDWTMTSVLGMLDSSQPSGYKEIMTETTDDYSYWFGAISVDGNLLDGGTLYFSPAFGAGIAGVTAVPEPGTFLLLGMSGIFGTAIFIRRRSQKPIAFKWRKESKSLVTRFIVGFVGTLILGQAAHAGIYSTGLANDPLINPNAPDAGIPGFVGPDGDGKCLTKGPNNYVNPIFKGWATGVVSYTTPAYLDISTYPTGNPGIFSHPEKSLGAVSGDNFDIVSLGDMYDPASPPKVGGVPVDPTVTTDKYAFIGYDAPGQITLSFAQAIRNGSGADFAVFENAFISGGGAGVAGQTFAELAYVEVSTNGVDFSRFPSISLTPAKVGAYGTIDSTNVYNLAGKHVNAYGNSWGTPFNLDDLTTDSNVTAGLVNLSEINYVRMVDIAGNGSFLDSQGHGIYDAWVTWGSGGLDLDAVGVINQVPEPGTLIGCLTVFGVCLFEVCRRRWSKQSTRG